MLGLEFFNDIGGWGKVAYNPWNTKRAVVRHLSNSDFAIRPKFQFFSVFGSRFDFGIFFKKAKRFPTPYDPHASNVFPLRFSDKVVVAPERF